MSFLDIMMIAVGLAMDACVVSAGAGASGISAEPSGWHPEQSFVGALVSGLAFATSRWQPMHER